eukprot:1273270-Amphidinium_carterae.1
MVLIWGLGNNVCCLRGQSIAPICGVVLASIQQNFVLAKHPRHAARCCHEKQLMGPRLPFADSSRGSSPNCGNKLLRPHLQSSQLIFVCQLHWVKAHQTRQAVDDGQITMEDFHATRKLMVVANLGAHEHTDHEPSAEYLHWEVVAQAVNPSSNHKLRTRTEAWPRAKLPAPVEEEAAP